MYNFRFRLFPHHTTIQSFSTETLQAAVTILTKLNPAEVQIEVKIRVGTTWQSLPDPDQDMIPAELEAWYSEWVALATTDLIRFWRERDLCEFSGAHR